MRRRPSAFFGSSDSKEKAISDAKEHVSQDMLLQNGKGENGQGDSFWCYYGTDEQGPARKHGFAYPYAQLVNNVLNSIDGPEKFAEAHILTTAIIPVAFDTMRIWWVTLSNCIENAFTNFPPTLLTELRLKEPDPVRVREHFDKFLVETDDQFHILNTLKHGFDGIIASMTGEIGVVTDRDTRERYPDDEELVRIVTQDEWYCVAMFFMRVLPVEIFNRCFTDAIDELIEE